MGRETDYNNFRRAYSAIGGKMRPSGNSRRLKQN